MIQEKIQYNAMLNYNIEKGTQRKSQIDIHYNVLLTGKKSSPAIYSFVKSQLFMQFQPIDFKISPD